MESNVTQLEATAVTVFPSIHFHQHLKWFNPLDQAYSNLNLLFKLLKIFFQVKIFFRIIVQNLMSTIANSLSNWGKLVDVT